MDVFSKPVLIYRWVVFLLAAFYVVYELVTGAYGPPSVGGPFRFLTIWALLVSFYAASRMLAYTERRISTQHYTVASVAAVLNVMVVFLYWKLYFTDPTLVNNGAPPIWWKEYYLHLLGPVLQWFDAMFILGAFRTPLRSLAALIAVVLLYIGVTELVFAPISESPVGSVTTGLPYPFLNAMELSERAQFYATNLALAVGVYAAFFAAGWIMRRLRPSASP